MQYLKVPGSLFAAIHHYLQNQPFREVAGLIGAMDAQCSEITESTVVEVAEDGSGQGVSVPE